MTKYTGSIRIAEKPWKQIGWFTRNFDKEIGAIGIGKVQNQELYVEKLFFPTQIVSGAHVHFKPEDWGTLMKEMTKEELDKVIFYWHKHPNGCVSASQGDEDDTIDVFMDEDSTRKVFGFLQTAKNTRDGSIESEARIEMRKPIWASIEAEITTDIDEEVEVECEKILKEKVTEGCASSEDQPGYGGINKDIKTYGGNAMPSFRNSKVVPLPNVGFIKTNTKSGDSNNDIFIFEITANNGNIELTVSSNFEMWVEDMLSNDVEFKEFIHKVSKKINGMEICFNIQPKKKKAREIEDKLHKVEEEIFGFSFDNAIAIEEDEGEGMISYIH